MTTTRFLADGRPAASAEAGMGRSRSLSLSLELISDGHRITGRLRDRHGNDWPFSSWLGLLTSIERLRTGAASPSEERSEGEGS